MDEMNVKLSSLAEISKSQLVKILNSVDGPKDLTLEPELIRPLERICGVSWLKLNGVEKIFKLEPTAPKLPNVQFYMIYTDIKTFKTVLEIIQSQLDLENPKCNKYHVICVPKSLYVFEDLLEELGLYHSVIKLYSLQWFPIHIDTGLLSLELPGMFRSVYLQQDYTLLPVFAKSLWHLQFVFGKINFMLCLGQYSNVILNQLNSYYDNPVETNGDVNFSGLVLMDRNVDYASTLLTPGTYTALLKEIYTVHCGVCECKDVEVKPYDEKYNPTVKKQAVNFNLDSNKDSTYRDIKNRYFTEVTSTLSALTKQLRSEGESSKEMALDEIKNYVKTQLQVVTSRKKNISNHLLAAETIINSIGHRFERQIEIERNAMQNKGKSSNFSYLEEALQTENDRYSSLILMCLIAVTQKLSEGEVKSFLNKYFLEFGYDYGFLYRNLIKANIVQEVSTASMNLPSKIIKLPLITSNNFYTNTNRLRLVPAEPDKIDLKSPSCCSYVFGGSYIPLIAQVVGMLFSGTPLEDVRGKLSHFGALQIKDSGYPLQKKTLLVCIVGGVTYSEVAALNLIEKLCGARVVVLSDKCVSGRDIVDALLTA